MHASCRFLHVGSSINTQKSHQRGTEIEVSLCIFGIAAVIKEAADKMFSTTPANGKGREAIHEPRKQRRMQVVNDIRCKKSLKPSILSTQLEMLQCQEGRKLRKQCSTALNSAIKRFKMNTLLGRPRTDFQEISAPSTEMLGWRDRTTCSS